MKRKIYLKDEINKKIFEFDTLKDSFDFYEKYPEPNKLVNILDYYCDGAGWNGKISRVAYGEKDNIQIHSFDINLTNNESEYISCLLACTYAENDCLIFSDSKLIVNQINKGWKINKENLRFYNHILNKVIIDKNLTLRWIPRADNYAGVMLDRTK